MGVIRITYYGIDNRTLMVFLSLKVKFKWIHKSIGC